MNQGVIKGSIARERTTKRVCRARMNGASPPPSPRSGLASAAPSVSGALQKDEELPRLAACIAQMGGVAEAQAVLRRHLSLQVPVFTVVICLVLDRHLLHTYIVSH